MRILSHPMVWKAQRHARPSGGCVHSHTRRTSSVPVTRIEVRTPLAVGNGPPETAGSSPVKTDEVL